MPNDQGSERRDGSAPAFYLQSVASRNPFEEVFSQLARAIRVGAVGIGEKFPPERELSERLGVSRSTIREAIRGLEQAGYITTRRGRSGGTFVLRSEAVLPDQDRKRALGPRLIHALDFRAVVEPGAAALAAQKPNTELIGQMRSLVDEMKQGDQTDFVRKNCRLHILIAQVADCPPVLNAVISVELEVMDAFLAMPNVEPPEGRYEDQHREIIDLIANGDAEGARAAMEEHLAGTDLLTRGFVSTEGAAD